MTSKEYYKQTSDMAFFIDDYRLDGNTIKATIQLNENETPEDILNKNDFFALEDFDRVNTEHEHCYLSTVSFEIMFIYNSKHFVSYSLRVCDTIDCRIGGGHMVFSCDEYEKLDEVFEPDETENKTECTTDATVNGKVASFFDDDFFGFHFPCIDDFDKCFKRLSDSFESIKSNGGNFCSVSYSLDGNGNGHYRKVDNDGVVEKHFKRVDGKVTEIKDDSHKEEKKTDLKDILK